MRTATTMQWTGNGYPLPMRWAFKKDVPKHWQPFSRRVIFNFEIAWIVRDHENRVLMPNGGWLTTFDFYLHTPGHVVGPCDMISADSKQWAVEWRNAMADRRLGR